MYNSLEPFAYLSREKLKSKIQKNSNIIVIDVREDDYIGGHIKNSVHISANKFHENITKVLQLVNTADEVILHCQESIKRSPRCAKILFNIIGKQIYILEGGFDQWVRNFWNTDLVEDYDDEYWYFQNDLGIQA